MIDPFHYVICHMYQLLLSQAVDVRMVFNRYNVYTIYVTLHNVQTYLMLNVYHQVVVNVQLISLTLLVTMSQAVVVRDSN